MILRKILCPAILILACTAGIAQSRADRIKLKNEFIKDSLGCLGRRLSYIDTTVTYSDSASHQVRRKILIGGIDLTDQRETTIIETLGKPNSSWVKFYSNPEIEDVIFGYYLTTCGKDKPGLTLVFRINNGDIDSISIESQ